MPPAGWALLTTISAETDASSDGGAPTLAVLLQRRSSAPHAGEWGLPGSMVREREQLAAAVRRTLVDKCGIEALEPQQLQVFDDPGRDDRGWVMSVAHLAVVPEATLGEGVDRRDDLMLAPIVMRADDEAAGPAVAFPGCHGALPFDHDRIVALAVADLRDRYRSAPDPAGLVVEPFSLLELRLVHEAVLGQSLQKDTFRRQMLLDLEQADGHTDGTVGRPARLFRLAAG